MRKEMTQKQALESAINVMRGLLESTKNKQAQASIEQALMYMGQVRSHVVGDVIPEYCSILLRNVNGRRVTIEE